MKISVKLAPAGIYLYSAEIFEIVQVRPVRGEPKSADYHDEHRIFFSGIHIAQQEVSVTVNGFPLYKHEKSKPIPIDDQEIHISIRDSFGNARYISYQINFLSPPAQRSSTAGQIFELAGTHTPSTSTQGSSNNSRVPQPVGQQEVMRGAQGGVAHSHGQSTPVVSLETYIARIEMQLSEMKKAVRAQPAVTHTQAGRPQFSSPSHALSPSHDELMALSEAVLLRVQPEESKDYDNLTHLLQQLNEYTEQSVEHIINLLAKLDEAPDLSGDLRLLSQKGDAKGVVLRLTELLGSNTQSQGRLSAEQLEQRFIQIIAVLWEGEHHEKSVVKELVGGICQALDLELILPRVGSTYNFTDQKIESRVQKTSSQAHKAITSVKSPGIRSLKTNKLIEKARVIIAE